MIPTPGPLLVRASRRLYENMAYTVGGFPGALWPPSSLATRMGSEGLLQPLLCPLIRPIFADCGRIKGHSSRFFLLYPRVLWSPTDSLAVRKAFFVAGFFACPSSPCAPFPVSSLPCFGSDTVWLVLWLVTVLQGPCQMAVLRESAGLALFRSLTVPLWGSVPSCCCCFTLLAWRVFVALSCLLRYWLGFYLN